MNTDKSKTKVDISDPLLSPHEKEHVQIGIPKVANQKRNYYFNANCLSSMLYWWVGNYISAGQKKAFEQDMHGLLKDKDAVDAIAKDFRIGWVKHKTLIRTIFTVQRSFFIKGFVFTIMGLSLLLMGPVLLNQIVSYVNSPKEQRELYLGIILIAGIAITKMMASVLSNQGFLNLMLLGNRTLSGVSALVYAKCLSFSILQSDDHNEGSITNNIQVDTMMFSHFGFLVSGIIGIPVQLIFAYALICYYAGWLPMAAGIVTMLLMLVASVSSTKKFAQYQEIVMKKRDARMKSTTEMVNGIKVIKLGGMEDEFFDRVAAKRDDELNLLRKQYYPYIFTIFCTNATPLFITASIFLTYILKGHELSAEIAFPIIATMGILQYPLTMIPFIMGYSLRAVVSMRRIEKFLKAPDVDASYITRNDNHDDDLSITVENGYFFWRKPEAKEPGANPNTTQILNSVVQKGTDTDATISWSEADASRNDSTFNEGLVEPHILKNINLKIRSGQFVAIIGDVGSGKSSLIQSFIGEIIADEKRNPRVVVNGSIAYVSQKAWILNKTVRDNILFNQEFNEERYQEAIELACLTDDLKVLPRGDMTEIGEKGVNLSGGQKARVSLARAIYCNRDIYLLDDPLAALDVHVGTTVMQNCLTNHLKSKTRVLVTHNLDMLKYVGRVIIMRKGAIIGDGTYEEIKEHPYYKAMVEKFQKKRAEEEEEEAEDQTEELQPGEILSEVVLEKKASSKKKVTRHATPHKELEKPKVEEAKGDNKDDDKLILAEDREKGEVGVSIFKSGLDFYGGWCFAIFLFIVMSIWLGSSLSANFWISYWTSPEGQALGKSQLFFVAIYFGFSFTFSFFTLIRIWALISRSITGAKKIHAQMIRSVLRAPINMFFDRVPAGRILNRFSKDINVVDTWLYESVSNIFVSIFFVLGDILISFYGGSYYILPLVLIFFWVSLTVQKRYIRVNNEITRLEAITKSPIVSHVGQTLSGLNSIRAYGVSEKFMSDQIELQNENLKNSYMLSLLNGWLSTRLVFAAMTLVVPVIGLTMFMNNTLTPGLAGIIVTYALRFDDDIRTFLNNKGLIEQRLISLERCVAFMKIEPEAAAKTTTAVEGYDPKHWPSEGKIEFVDFELRYRPNLPLVLKGINFTINPREKIGIVGRTGSGKSTTLLGLLRSIEAAGGKIMIDGVDISAIGLYDLRKKITIIPQDAMLYAGTLRENLDIFKQHSNEEIMDLLEKISLKDRFANGLEFEIKADGSNLSEGEKQLVCIARAILRKNKIVLIDEATSNIDMDTEELIQKAIAERFTECTTITIAHRLNTIIHSDRILVMGDGKVLEFDTPQNLLQNPNSEFAALWNRAVKEKVF